MYVASGIRFWLNRQVGAVYAKTLMSSQALLSAGATLAGTTQMDELAYSLNGENVHYGTPRNPACPDRIPGGSSSGSAVSLSSAVVIMLSQWTKPLGIFTE